MSVQTGWPSTGWRGWKAWMAWKSQSENKHLHLSRHPMTGEGWAGWCGWQAREEGVTGQGVSEGEKLEGEEVDVVGQEVGGVAVEGVPVRVAMEVALGWWQQVSLRLWFGVVQCLQVLPCSSLAAPDKVWGVWVCRCHCGRSWCTPKHASLWPSSAWRKHNPSKYSGKIRIPFLRPNWVGSRRTQVTYQTSLTSIYLLATCYYTCTHLCLSCNSLYSSRRITAPARVSRRIATLRSKLQQDFPPGPDELQLLGLCGVCGWRGSSIPRFGLMIALTNTGWMESSRNGCRLLNIRLWGWGGIWREVGMVTGWPSCIAASLIQWGGVMECSLM